jgi:hypothetical protein
MKFFKKKFKLPPIQNYPGYEATDEAFLHAQTLVLDVLKFQDYPKWGVTGQNGLNNYLIEYKKKVPDADFGFVVVNMQMIWNSFSRYLLSPEISGAWTKESSSEVYKIFASIFSTFPQKYKPAGADWVAAAGTLHICFDVALNSDKQILAQPIIENLLIIWLHYCLSFAEKD